MSSIEAKKKGAAASAEPVRPSWSVRESRGTVLTASRFLTADTKSNKGLAN
jgi:hypothetical protein